MATQKQIVNRLKRARGQLDGLIEQLEQGDANCRDVLTQFAAVNSAISRASYLTVATIMSQCTLELAEAEGDEASAVEASAVGASAVEASAVEARDGEGGAGKNDTDEATDASNPQNFVKTDHITLEELEKLFLSLA